MERVAGPAEGSAFVIRIQRFEGGEDEAIAQVEHEVRRRGLWGSPKSAMACVGTCRAFPGDLFAVWLLVAWVT